MKDFIMMTDDAFPLTKGQKSRAQSKCELYFKSKSGRLLKTCHEELNKIAIQTMVLKTPTKDKSTPVTNYVMRINNGLVGDAYEAWVVQHRYSEFRDFRKTFLDKIKKWEDCVNRHETAVRGMNAPETKEFNAMSSSLRQIMTNDFPRRRLGGKSEDIVAERSEKLEAFVKMLLNAYTDLCVYLYEYKPQYALTGVLLQKMFNQLQSFLNVPDSQKTREECQRSAILSLQDMEETKSPEGEHYICCICMSNDQCCEAKCKDKLVRLPCDHHFHEGCVIDWFNTSMSCPLCRLSVAGTCSATSASPSSLTPPTPRRTTL